MITLVTKWQFNECVLIVYQLSQFLYMVCMSRQVITKTPLLKPGTQVQRFVEKMLRTGKGLVAFLQCMCTGNCNIQAPLNLFLKHCCLNMKTA